MKNCKSILVLILFCSILPAALVAFSMQRNYSHKIQAITERSYSVNGEGDLGLMLTDYVVNGNYTDGFSNISESEFWGVYFAGN